MKTVKRMSALLCLLAMLAALAGCGRKQAEPAAQQPEQPGAQQGAQTAPEQGAQPTEPEKEPERPAVEDNGGQFVGVDGKVWFRLYDAGVFDEARLWGEFLAVRISHAVPSKLCCYDPATDSVTEVAKDDGFGELWFGVDGFYLSRCHSAGSDAYFKTLDGKDIELGDGDVLGVSDNGRYAAIRDSGGAIRVYRGTEQLDALAVPSDADYLAFCALTDEGALICCAYDYTASKASLLLFDAPSGDSEPVSLGELPALPEGSTTYSWELAQCLLDGSDVWCAFGAYEGTGNFLSDTLVVRAKLDAANSLERVEDQPTSEYPFVPKLYKASDGAVCRSEYLPGELSISAEDGSLLCFDENGSVTAQLDEFPPDLYEGGKTIVQTVEHIGGAAYIALALAERSPENDLGWREAYKLRQLRYLRAELSAGAQAEPLDGLEWAPETTPDVGAVLPDFLGSWTLYATEVEGYRDDALPDGTWEIITFKEDGSVIVEGSEYQQRFLHAEVLPTNGVDAEASPYGLLFTDGANDDMLWAYFEGDTLVATMMLHSVGADGGTESYSRTGFYRSSVS